MANGSKYYAFYSTPACYTLAVHTEKPNGWTVKTDDFFPYGFAPNYIWTGFFTSRPTLKSYARLADSFQQARSNPLVVYKYNALLCVLVLAEYFVNGIVNLQSFLMFLLVSIFINLFKFASSASRLIFTICTSTV